MEFRSLLNGSEILADKANSNAESADRTGFRGSENKFNYPFWSVLPFLSAFKINSDLFLQHLTHNLAQLSQCLRAVAGV